MFSNEENENIINIWDLETENKDILAPIKKIEMSSPANYIKVYTSKSKGCLLLCGGKEGFEVYQITFQPQVNALSKFIINDQGESILSCSFVKSSKVLVYLFMLLIKIIDCS